MNNMMPDDPETIPSSNGPFPKSFQLSRQQRILHQALMREDQRLAGMYLGALLVLEHIENPENVVMAAHSLRELLEKLPMYLDLPVTRQTNLKVKVIDLSQGWYSVTKNSRCKGNPSWNGPVDRPLQTFLERTEKFFEWFKEQYQTRRERAAILLRGLDPLRLSLPTPIEDLRITEWYKYHEYFEKISHHGVIEGLQEFRTWLVSLEKFLLDHLCPRTFDDQEDIKRIIEEGEANGEG